MTVLVETNCWYCYRADTGSGSVCETCHHPVQPPTGTHAVDVELWALSHPDPDRRRRAVEELGMRREARAERPLRALVNDGVTDPDLAIAAMRALVRIAGPAGCAPVLAVVATTRHGRVRAAALGLLSH